MSMPSFPDFNPDITCENAISMILTSIAMEELALSHIINAEGEKLQAVLKHLDADDSQCGGKYPVDELLKVNKSIADLLDSVSKNQMLLKSKMERALDALTETGCRKPPSPNSPNNPCAYNKCNAIFTVKKCNKWNPDTSLSWNESHQHGDCVRQAPADPSHIEILKKGRFLISFLLNVRGLCIHTNRQDIAVSVVDSDNNTLYTVYAQTPRQDTTVSISMSGMSIDTLERELPYALHLTFESSGPLAVEQGTFSITEI